MTYIEELQDVIHKLHGVSSTHIESVPLTERFREKTLWDGIVEVFELHGHPRATHVYAWVETDDPRQPKRTVTVLKVPPVASAEAAVRLSVLKDLGPNVKKT